MSAPASISLKATNRRTVYTGDTVKIDVGGRSSFRAGFTGWARLALYAHLDLPKAGTDHRKALARGGWQAWFQQVVPASEEADRRDETGLLGLVPFALFGPNRTLVSHSWPHTVDADPWEFCIEAWAFGPSGVAVRVPLGLTVREVKILPARSA